MLLHYLALLGLCVQAITGALAAGRKKMDLFGVLLIACITALGGGSVRDVLFHTYPLSWVMHPEYLLYTSVCAIISIVLAQYLTRFMLLFLILDALGLAAFVVIGTEKVLAYGLPLGAAVLSGLITGISGGMLRDILCNDIPLVLRKELYAVIALAGSVLFLSLNALGLAHNLNIVISLLTMFLLRLWAIFYHIHMPVFEYNES